jgi:hypothetical protein
MTLPDEIYVYQDVDGVEGQDFWANPARPEFDYGNAVKYVRADAAPKVEELVFVLKLAHATIIADKGYGYRPNTYKIITWAIKKYDTLTPKHAEEVKP